MPAFLRSWNLAAGVGIALVMMAVGWLVRDHARLRDLDGDRRACVAAVAKGGELARCDRGLTDQVMAARRAKACDAALAADEAYGVRATCSNAVKTVAARAGALATTVTDLRRALDDALAAASQAAARGEARGRREALGNARAQRTIEDLRPGPAGLLRCDDDCLRRLTEPGGDAASAGG